MPGKFCVSLTCAKDDPDRATVAFVVANAALGSGQETVVFLSTEGVRLGVKGYADDVHEEGFAPLRELMANFASAGPAVTRNSVKAKVPLIDRPGPPSGKFGSLSSSSRTAAILPAGAVAVNWVVCLVGA